MYIYIYIYIHTICNTAQFFLDLAMIFYTADDKIYLKNHLIYVLRNIFLYLMYLDKIYRIKQTKSKIKLQKTLPGHCTALHCNRYNVPKDRYYIIIIFK